jgi:hypothetical protein
MPELGDDCPTRKGSRKEPALAEKRELRDRHRLASWGFGVGE